VGATIWKLDRDGKLLNAIFSSAYPVDLKSVEPIQKHVNKYEQRMIPELNGIKITSWMTYDRISLSQKEPYNMKMIQNNSDIN